MGYNKVITTAMREEAYLQHHGIIGMKWGVRRTPEQLGHRTKKENKTQEQEVNGIGLYIASLAFDAAVEQYSKASAEKLDAKNADRKIEKISDLERNVPPKSMHESSRIVNKHATLNKNFKRNCPNTSLAYELQRRGFDAYAKPALRGDLIGNIYKMFNSDKPDISFERDGLIFTKGNKSYNETINKYLDEMPNGYRGIVTNTWQTGGGGHNWSIEKSNDKVYMIDAQSGKIQEHKNLSFIRENNTYDMGPGAYISKSSSVQFLRVDNKQINDAIAKDKILKASSKGGA